MINNTEQQIFDSLNKATRILIALPRASTGDALGAGCGLYYFLKKLDKQPELVSASPTVSQFEFLPAVQEIKQSIDAAQSFVISVKTEQAELDELSYETNKDRIDIFLKPKKGKFSENDISFRSARFPYDLIITLDTPSLEHLGEVYENNTDLFFETPVINIDHHPSNEHYGEINLVDLTATSSSEIVATLIENYEASLIDENIATALLTGIIVETNSFQHVKTTPKAFLKASNLVSMGANQQEIIRQLYKTRHVSLLKLWGRALARIKEIPELGLTYSLVNHNDILKAESSPEHVLGVMRELVGSLAGRKIILLLAEVSPREVIGYFNLHPSIRAQVVASTLSGQMLNGSLGMFKLKDVELLEVEKEVLEKLGKIRDQIAA